ncbi:MULTISPECIES: hypothetical protein [Sphingobium]|uniref:hypothetical protein n=1 Tax=Sphingobium TaxID=165695 RepID=UPI0017C8564D|nr:MULTISPECIES: hypothetical protein [Sphingobium]MCW2362100.1 putative hemolysin [Sphingobium sp. B10D3B]MCW2394832.1 putative hemolysin [Sphingobium sp. B8D3B]MCW2418346.1 putative hemolysin [Sphingobium sp. B8D3C]
MGALRIRIGLASAALALALGGCAPRIGLVDGVPSSELNSCARQGGSLQARGRAQTVMCVVPYADAGKSCASKKDCQGRCLAQPGKNGALPLDEQKAPGRCQADNKLFGCFAELDGGKVVRSMCID